MTPLTASASCGAMSLFSGTNWFALNVAPWGSRMTVPRIHGASNGGTSTVPPSSAARSAIASASATPNVTSQCAGVSGWSSGITLTAATTSSKRSGPPISAVRSRVPGLSASRWSPYAGSAHMPIGSASQPNTAP